MRVVDLRIEDIAFGGKGVGRQQGKVVFVPYTIEDELVSAEILREKKQFAEAELVEVTERSPDRIEPECPYFGRCGGCAYQHIDYEHQLAIKSRQVSDVLQRIGKLKDIPMGPMIPSPKQYRYRNRITVHAQNEIVGFFRRDSHRLLDIEQCPISCDEVNRELRELRGRNPRDGHYTLRAAAGRRVFSQTNDEVADALRDLVADMVPPNQDLLIDAYCGAGFFAKALLDRFSRVVGIDWDRFAVAAAKEGATEKETYVAGEIEEELARAYRSSLFEDETARADTPHSFTLIVDPPAAGLSGKMRRTILDLSPTTLIYVSCNPATLARDLKELGQKFSITSITPLDMFPQTAEIEVAVHLRVKDEQR